MNMRLRTSPYLSKFEIARILGLRALQLSWGAEPRVPCDGITNVHEIALLEFEKNLLNFEIRRHLPDGSYEDVNVNQLLR